MVWRKIERATKLMVNSGLTIGIAFLYFCKRGHICLETEYKICLKISKYVWSSGPSQMTKEEKDLFVEYTLSVSSVTEEDIGAYHCKVEYPQGAQISQPAYLQILGQYCSYFFTSDFSSVNFLTSDYYSLKKTHFNFHPSSILQVLDFSSKLAG